jgi:mannosyltransferase OCH1-like enzyme
MISFTEKMMDKNKKYNIQIHNPTIFKVPIPIPINQQNLRIQNVQQANRGFTNFNNNIFRTIKSNFNMNSQPNINYIEKDNANEKMEVNNKMFKINLNIDNATNDESHNSQDKYVYNPIIPLKIFQTWFSKNLPDGIQKCVDELKALNPEFEYFLYDDEDCHNFIRDNFDKDVVESFDTLVPGAYKADLWRYCVLYIHGGIYLDIKYRCINNFRLISLSENVWFVKDMESSGTGIYNALMVTTPRNPLYLNFINKVVYNVKNRFYGENSLCPTGPHMLKQFFNQKYIQNIHLQHSVVYNQVSRENNYFIFDKQTNRNIMKIDDNYRNEQRLNTNNKRHYSTMWENREIYTVPFTKLSSTEDE